MGGMICSKVFLLLKSDSPRIIIKTSLDFRFRNSERVASRYLIPFLALFWAFAGDMTILMAVVTASAASTTTSSIATSTASSVSTITVSTITATAISTSETSTTSASTEASAAATPATVTTTSGPINFNFLAINDGSI